MPLNSFCCTIMIFSVDIALYAAGFLCDKVIDKIADDTDIGLTRNTVSNELKDIKTKLRCLSRKDLNASYMSLEEGMNLLIGLPNDSKLEQKVALDKAQENVGETSRISSNAVSKLLDRPGSMDDIKIHIKNAKLTQAARDRFTDARKAAAQAFGNAGLRIKERIFAAKLRIVSEVLEFLESPEVAVIGCRTFLKELHELPAIRKIFSMFLYGGFKSMFKGAKRSEKVKSVMLINRFVFQHASKYGGTKPFVLDWPTIQVTGHNFNPILYWHKVSKRNLMTEYSHPNGICLDEGIRPKYSAVSSGETAVAVMRKNKEIKTFSNQESRLVELSHSREVEPTEKKFKGIAVDNDNNTYVLTWLQKRVESGDTGSYVLYVLDEEHNVQNECTLGVFEENTDAQVRMVVNKSNHIIMTKASDPYVYICDSTGGLKNKFKREPGEWLASIGISDKNDIMISSTNKKEVHIYSEEGTQTSSIQLPEHNEVCGIAFHSVCRKIIVLAYVKNEASYVLLCFSENGELEKTVFLSKQTKELKYTEITSHSSGLVAVVRKRTIIFI